MERFKIIKSIGDGTFGAVSKASIISSGEIVAVKKMKTKFFSWEECLELREIKVLRKITHSNIIRLKEVVRANDELNLIFEYCEKNLYQQQSEAPLPESQIKEYIRQILQGLAHLHKNGFFHRDIKPDNILISSDTAKIADFGLAKEIRSQGPCTEYVSTRWYRAPEVLLHSRRYNWQVDIFAVGCIAAELYLNRPIFPGSSEIDQLNRLCSVLGTPNEWVEGQRLAAGLHYVFPQYISTSLNEIIQNTSSEAIEFIGMLLRWDPLQRPSAEACLQHPYLNAGGNRQSKVVNDIDKAKSKAGTIRLGGLAPKPGNIGIGRHKLNN
jgi:serine/threonine protein kinase